MSGSFKAPEEAGVDGMDRARRLEGDGFGLEVDPEHTRQRRPQMDFGS